MAVSAHNSPAEATCSAPPSYFKAHIVSSGLVRNLSSRSDVVDASPRQLAHTGKGLSMSSTETNMRTGAGKRASSARDAEDLNAQIEAIRADIQSLTSTVGRIANKQLKGAQDKAMETAAEAEEAIKRNPLYAVAIAVGLGFLFGALTRR